MKKVIIAGGSGFIGKALSQYFLDKNYKVVVLTRKSSSTENGIIYQNWDAKTIGEWTNHLSDADLLINLTGKSVDCRYTDKNKQEILASRVDATNVLGKAINNCKTPPKLWINSSTATIYKHSLNQPMDEDTGEIGNDFSMNVAQQWEKSFFSSSTPLTRKVALRISLVLGKNEGVLPVLKTLCKLGLGGEHGSGKQKFAWIHIKDLIRIVDFIVENEQLKGYFNCTSPEVIDNTTFMKTLRTVVRAPFGLPTPKWMLKIGTFFLRTESELILKSRYVIPKRLTEAGFTFQFNTAESALQDLINGK